MKLFISPWKSSTPRTLSKSVGTRLRRLADVDGLKVDAIVNWGCSSLRGCSAPLILNKPSHVSMASDKLKCLQALASGKVQALEFTDQREVAIDWNRKHSIIAHSDVHGHSGSGLVRVAPEATLYNMPYCGLYTKYFQKDTEVRVLCIKEGAGYATMFLEKKRILPERYGEFGLAGKPDWFIRTHNNGWIFSRESAPIQGALDMAASAMEVLGLEFGAVDVLVKNKTGGTTECRVGEVNTAPGLDGQTLEFFKTGLSRLLKKAA